MILTLPTLSEGKESIKKKAIKQNNQENKRADNQVKEKKQIH